jgi:hypothetical protein
MIRVPVHGVTVDGVTNPSPTIPNKSNPNNSNAGTGINHCRLLGPKIYDSNVVKSQRRYTYCVFSIRASNLLKGVAYNVYIETILTTISHQVVRDDEK